MYTMLIQYSVSPTRATESPIVSKPLCQKTKVHEMCKQRKVNWHGELKAVPIIMGTRKQKACSYMTYHNIDLGSQ